MRKKERETEREKISVERAYGQAVKDLNRINSAMKRDVMWDIVKGEYVKKPSSIRIRTFE